MATADTFANAAPMAGARSHAPLRKAPAVTPSGVLSLPRNPVVVHPGSRTVKVDEPGPSVVVRRILRNLKASKSSPSKRSDLQVSGYASVGGCWYGACRLDSVGAVAQPVRALDS